MGKTRKLTRASLMTAVAAVLVYAAAWVPRGALALIALSALVGAAVVVECGPGWALAHYAVTCLLTLLLSPDKSLAIWYAAFFGHYPVCKHYLERLPAAALRWAGKLALFFGCAALLYFVFSAAFAAALPQLPLYYLAPALGLVFVLYDLAMSRLIARYCRSVHRAV